MFLIIWQKTTLAFAITGHLYSVRCMTRFSLMNLLWNHWAKWKQAWQWWSMGGPISKLCQTHPLSIWNGHC